MKSGYKYFFQIVVPIFLLFVVFLFGAMKFGVLVEAQHDPIPNDGWAPPADPEPDPEPEPDPDPPTDPDPPPSGPSPSCSEDRTCCDSTTGNYSHVRTCDLWDGQCIVDSCGAGYHNCPGWLGCSLVEDEDNQYQLQTSVSPAASGTISPSTGYHDEGTNVTVTKSAYPGYVFDRWTGACTGRGSCSVAMIRDRFVIANFVHEDNDEPATLIATLTASPTSGTEETVFNFTATVGGTATGDVAFTSPSCGDSGATLSDWSGNTDPTFSCQYSTGGTKTAGITVERGGATATPEADVQVGLCVCSPGSCVAIPGEPCSEDCGPGFQDGLQTITCNPSDPDFCSLHGTTQPCTIGCNLGACPEIDEMWIESSPWVKRGETREVHWRTSHVTSCTLEREPSPILPSSFSVGPSGPFLTGAINFVTKFTLTCTNVTGVTDTDSIFIRVLPTFKEV